MVHENGVKIKAKWSGLPGTAPQKGEFFSLTMRFAQEGSPVFGKSGQCRISLQLSPRVSLGKVSFDSLGCSSRLLPWILLMLV
jgi:hypothetical protein